MHRESAWLFDAAPLLYMISGLTHREGKQEKALIPQGFFGLVIATGLEPVVLQCE